MTVSAPPRPTTLAEWIAATIPPGIPALDAASVGSLRFLFYGRAFTHEHQDPRTSRAWQLDVSRRLTDGHGAIVGEYFEVGCSRQVPRHLRPRVAAMLRCIAANADRADAVVVGEYERAFLDGAQVRELRAVLEQFGVQLWLPEAEGPVDFDNPAHEALLSLLAMRSQTEVIRSRHRVVTAIRVQTVDRARLPLRRHPRRTPRTRCRHVSAHTTQAPCPAARTRHASERRRPAPAGGASWGAGVDAEAGGPVSVDGPGFPGLSTVLHGHRSSAARCRVLAPHTPTATPTSPVPFDAPTAGHRT
ncbi:recombinase family protein [Saccharothrix sp. Mg75]|uniref:recombinase family protein n=1 Tax=Saccharothrix sp. Mg75 TaxID=3445357 RepID=UPI003EE9BAC5